MKEGFKDLQRERPKNRTFNLFLSKEKKCWDEVYALSTLSNYALSTPFYACMSESSL